MTKELHFQLTYTVEPNYDNEAATAKARKLIKEIEGWQSMKHIETTVVGKLSVKLNDDRHVMRSEAKNIVKDKIKKTLRGNEIYTEVRVYLSLMVSGLGPHIEFNF